MKLFSSAEELDLPTPKVETGDSDDVNMEVVDSDIEALENHVDAYVSVSNVYEEVSSEAFSFVDKKNYTLFNEYMNVISKNLGIKNVPVVSTEAIAILPTVALNHHIALEGFIGDMWAKVKALFVKIYEGIKAFFKKHFTRLGSLKKKLNNLKEVLTDTDKDLKQLNLENIPSAISSKFPYSGMVDEAVVIKATEISGLAIAALEVTNKEATKLASRDILSKDFVAKVKTLKEQIAANSSKIAENDSKKVGGLGVLKKENRLNNKELNKENESLSAMNKDNKAEVEDAEGTLGNIVNSNIDSTFDDTEYLAAKKEMAAYVKRVEQAFTKLTGKPIPGGKTVKEVKVTGEDGITLEFDTNKDEPSSVSLGAKNGLLKLVTASIQNLETMEKATDNYTKVNDTIMNNLDAVDKLIAELDKVSDNKDYAKYKKVLQNKVKERLKLMQTFFTNYNKVNKTLIGVVADTCDGVVAYAVASLKHFG